MSRNTLRETTALNLKEILVRPVQRFEEERYQALMQAHHYLGAIPKIGETLWYVAVWCGQWVALLSFSAAAWKCAVRDRWVGWDYRHQYDRLKLVSNNSRFLILPDWHYPILATRTLLCQRRLPGDCAAGECTGAVVSVHSRPILPYRSTQDYVDC